MINVLPIPFGDKIALGISVSLPKTNLVMVTTQTGYIMCGALDVGLLNTSPKLKARGILAARAVGVKTLDELLDAPMESVTEKAAEFGIVAGQTTGRQAIEILLSQEADTPVS